jgi:hypothetical protein
LDPLHLIHTHLTERIYPLVGIAFYRQNLKI